MSEVAPRQSQRLHAVLTLRELILEGGLEAGERIAEIPLAARLGVSRTPLRLALASVEHEGLVASVPGGGFVVRSFTLDDVRSAIAVRGAMEGLAARAAAERFATADDGTVESLYGCVARLDAVVAGGPLGEETFARYVALNERLHGLLLELAGSEVLREAVEYASARPFASPSAFVRAHAVLPESHEILRTAQAQHRAILGALEAGDGDSAERLTREHAGMALGNLHVVLREHGALNRVPGGTLIRLSAAS